MITIVTRAFSRKGWMTRALHFSIFAILILAAAPFIWAQSTATGAAPQGTRTPDSYTNLSPTQRPGSAIQPDDQAQGGDQDQTDIDDQDPTQQDRTQIDNQDRNLPSAPGLPSATRPQAASGTDETDAGEQGVPMDSRPPDLRNRSGADSQDRNRTRATQEDLGRTGDREAGGMAGKDRNGYGLPERSEKDATIRKSARKKEKLLPAAPNPYRNLPALDDLYHQLSSNANVVLQRFGMSVFTPKRQPGVQVKPVEGQVGVNYILGPGDTLKIEIWGGPSEHLTRVVDREGRVGIPEVGQVAVAGQSVADAQRQILNALKHEYREVTVDVSVARLRTTRVYVVGDVKNPGAYSVTGDATPLTLMIAAGGPTDSGTMRHLKHFRGSSLVADVDLYRFLLNGLRTDAQPFADGDTLLVPPVGPQVAVLGQVRRPAIYELKEEETLEETLALAGGVQVSGSLSEVTIDRVDPHGGNRTLTLKTAQGGKTVDAQLKSFAVQDGDRVAINAILPYREQTIYVQGHVFHPGRRGFHPGMTFTDLLGSYTEFLPEPADRAEIVRLSPPNYRPVVIPVSLNQIFNEHQAVALQPFDTVRIFGRYEEDIPKVTVEGDIVRPGQYPLSEGMKVSELVRLAGGLKRGAYAGIADLTTYQVVSDDHVELRHDEVQLSQALAGDSKDDLMLKPGDVLGIRQMTGWSNIGSTITIRGEVRYPGTFGIAPGDTLSSVLLRAGGFTEGAYPYGAVLNREQVRELALQSRDALVRKLKAEANVVSNKTEDQDKVKETEATRKQMILDLMSEPPSGRLAIDVGSDIKVWQGTVADIQVRPGDDLVIPKNMGFVMVNGQVYSPTALAYNPHRDAKWYLQNAGGLTRLADARNIFIIKANGRVVSARSSPLLGGGVLSKVLQPGDTIVVPQKLNTGSSIWKDLMQSAQLMSALAITAIAAGHL